jgi:hypothetical protein
MIVHATDCNRAFAAKGFSLGADFRSHIVDFKDMPMGSIQLLWSGAAGTLDGKFEIFASNIPEDPWFDDNPIDGAVMPVDAPNGGGMWLRDRLAFRYAQVRYTAGGTTAGVVDIVALGKKS